MPAVACNSDDGCFSLKGHKAKSPVFRSVHSVSWHVDVHDVTATRVTKVSKHMLETRSQARVDVTRKGSLSKEIVEGRANANTLQTNQHSCLPSNKIGCARELDSPKFGEVVAYIALSGASDKLANKDAWARVSRRAALTAGWALTCHHLPILHAYQMWGLRH